MIKKITIVLLSLYLISCNSYKDEFFDFIFGTNNISLNSSCSDNPSIFGEGRWIEIYSIDEKDINKIVKSINDYSPNKNHQKYLKYRTPIWRATPVEENDSIVRFVYAQMLEEKNDCFNEADIRRILAEEKNYYLPLYDNLGRIKLFILDTQKAKLFLISSYIL